MTEPQLPLVQLPERRLRLAFFGTPDIAATVLTAILDADRDDVVVAVCQPDRPRGRKRKIQPPPVKVLAEARGIEVLQPRKMRDGSVARAMKARDVDLAIVVAYGRILTEDTLASCPHGFWNVHASLLPRHRGASPIQHAIACGDSETGVALMIVTPGLDEGPVLMERRIPIGPDTTAETLTIELARLGGELTVEGLVGGKSDGLRPTPQDDDLATYAGLLSKQDGHLDLGRTAVELERQIRAFTPWPGASLPFDSGRLKVIKASAFDMKPGKIGTIAETSPRFVVHTAQGGLELLQVQPPGKKPMSAKDFLRGAGRGLEVGQTLLN